MAWPASGFFTGFATQGQLRQALDDQLERARAQVGADGVANATIASGAITGTSKGSLRVYGQGAAADDLVSLDTALYSEGQIVELRIGDVNQPITVKHNAAPGAGQFSLVAGIDYVGNALEQRIALERTGTYWTETERRGREKTHQFGAAGEPTFTAAFANGTAPLTFWKDPDGVVNLEGEVSVVSDRTVGGHFISATHLPAGWRPASGMVVPVDSSLTASIPVLRFLVETNGRLSVDVRVNTLTAGAVVYLNGIRFRAAN